MKRIITVNNIDTAELIKEETGASYMIQNISGRDAYTFVETEELRELLSDKKRFSRKDWYIDKKLRF